VIAPRETTKLTPRRAYRVVPEGENSPSAIAYAVGAGRWREVWRDRMSVATPPTIFPPRLRKKADWA